MAANEHHLTFGPVPSRRLGRSLGINNVTAKACSYSCVYCQLGPTTEQVVEPKKFFAPEQIRAAVADRLLKLRAAGVRVDYLTFVPDGEPTLDASLGSAIRALGAFDIPVAVITNATLLSRSDVRAALGEADLVSVKLDSADQDIWRRINRPHPALQFDRVLEGIRAFAAGYRGTLIADTMLIADINDGQESLTATAEFLSGIMPRTAYLAVPIRPTAVKGLHGPDEAGLIRAHEIFTSRLPAVELLTGHEAGTFAPTGDARGDLLAITAVHPMREADVRDLLAADDADWTLLEALLSEGVLKRVEYEGDRFYLRPVRCGRQLA